MDKEHFNLEKLHKQSPELQKNVAEQMLRNIEAKLEAEERLLAMAKTEGQKMNIESRIRSLQNEKERLAGGGHA